MKRFIAALLVVLLCLSCFSACGQSEEEIQAKPDTEEAVVTTEAAIEIEPEPEPVVIVQEPALALCGDSWLTVDASIIPYEDPGFIATDEQDGDITDSVVVEGFPVFHTPGEFDVTYSVADSDGNTASAIRHYSVVTAQAIETVYPEAKTIYLTFDDGPCVYTPDLLAILDEYPQVKVTFFVPGQFPKYYYLIGEEAARGHAIGVHTYKHRYEQDYTSLDTWFEGYMAMQDVIKEQTGSYSRLYRFPGGSSNGVSLKYGQGICTQIAERLSVMGCRYYDWNCSSGDASKTPATREQIVGNVIASAKKHDYIVVLQHDIKPSSIQAVRDIIEWGLENGYTFKALDITSPTTQQTIKN